jgi:hypothetical protein
MKSSEKRVTPVQKIMIWIAIGPVPRKSKQKRATEATFKLIDKNFSLSSEEGK